MTKLIPIGVVVAMPISPTFAAEQYWIVQQSISSCTIVNEKPKSDIKILPVQIIRECSPSSPSSRVPPRPDWHTPYIRHCEG